MPGGTQGSGGTNGQSLSRVAHAGTGNLSGREGVRKEVTLQECLPCFGAWHEERTQDRAAPSPEPQSLVTS